MNARTLIEANDPERPHKGKPRHELLAGALASADELTKLQARKLELLKQHKQGLAQEFLRYGKTDQKDDLLSSHGLSWILADERTDAYGRRKWLFKHGSHIASIKILNELFGREAVSPGSDTHYTVSAYGGSIVGGSTFIDSEDYTADSPEEAVARGQQMAETMLRSWSAIRVSRMLAFDENKAMS